MMSRKRTGGLSPAAAVVLGILAGILVAALLMDWLVVDVRTTESQGHATRVWIPLPMAALRLAAAVIPRGSFEEPELPHEVRDRLPAIREALETLQRCPDGPLVQVTSPEGTVDVELKKGSVLVKVNAPDATVHAVVPLDGLVQAVGRLDRERSDRDLVRALLAALDDGFTVSVDAAAARVRVSVR